MSSPATDGTAPGATSTVLLTAVAMLAFAANSLLCRLALGQELVDAASFTAVRALAGALTLAVIMLPRWSKKGRARADWYAAGLLFAYMAFFSFAYLSLAAGTGALILFGAVQLTMFIAALRAGEHFALLSWGGLGLAVAGLVYLVSPGLTAPDPMGAVLMSLSGIAWGLYSLRGRNVADPVEATANNFISSVPFVVVVSLVFLDDLHGTPQGFTLAAISGAVTSGLGYVAWYAALSGLTATRAATVQLSVPAIAAFGGVLLLAEPLSARLVIASVATLGGIWMVLAQRAVRLADAD